MTQPPRTFIIHYAGKSTSHFVRPVPISTVCAALMTVILILPSMGQPVPHTFIPITSITVQLTTADTPFAGLGSLPDLQDLPWATKTPGLVARLNASNDVY